MHPDLRKELKDAITAIESDPPLPVAEPEPVDPEEGVYLPVAEAAYPPGGVCRKCGQRFLNVSYTHPFLCPNCAPQPDQP